MLPPNGEKRYHTKHSFFSFFFGNLPPNNNGKLTKNEYLHSKCDGSRITLGVVSLYSLVKKLIVIIPIIDSNFIVQRYGDVKTTT